MASNHAINYEAVIPDILANLEVVHATMAQYDFDRKLVHLVELRASQINGCAYCVGLHTRQARKDNETNERLDHVIVWLRADCFSAAEKAALEWTEALTYLHADTEYGSIRHKLINHFSTEQIGVLTSAIAMINLWNRFQISKH